MLQCDVQDQTEFKFQSKYTSFGINGRQSVFIFGSANGNAVYGLITIQANNGSCAWAGTGTVSVSSDANGIINVNFGHKVYDTFVLLSHSKIS